MKTQEEIENKANDWLVETPIEAWGGAENGFIKGYTQCQEDMADKKYTEEDVREAIRRTISYLSTLAAKGKFHSGNIIEESIINSLSKQD